MTATFMNAFYEPFAHAQIGPTHPLWNALPIRTSQCSNPGNMVVGKGYDHVPTSPDYPRGGRSEMDWDLGGSNRTMA